MKMKVQKVLSFYLMFPVKEYVQESSCFFFFNRHKCGAQKLMQNFFFPLNCDYYSWVKFNILLALLEKYWVWLFTLEVQRYVKVSFLEQLQCLQKNSTNGSISSLNYLTGNFYLRHTWESREKFLYLFTCLIQALASTIPQTHGIGTVKTLFVNPKGKDPEFRLLI